MAINLLFPSFPSQNEQPPDLIYVAPATLLPSHLRARASAAHLCYFQIVDHAPNAERLFVRVAACLQDETWPPPEASVQQLDLSRHLRAALASLSERQQQVLVLRFGLDAEAAGVHRTLAQVGQLLGITRERVRQLEAQALERLRHCEACVALTIFLDR